MILGFLGRLGRGRRIVLVEGIVFTNIRSCVCFKIRECLT